MSLIASTGGRVLFSLAKTAVGGEALRSSCAQSCSSCPNSGTCGATVGYSTFGQDMTFQGSDRRLGEVRVNLGKGVAEERPGRQPLQVNAGNTLEPDNHDSKPSSLMGSRLGSPPVTFPYPREQIQTRLTSSSENGIPSQRRGSVCYNVLVDLGYL